jgi:hypothetical protein
MEKYAEKKPNQNWFTSLKQEKKLSMKISLKRRHHPQDI